MNGAASNARRAGVTILTSALAIGVLVVLLTRIDVRDVEQSVANANPWLLASAVLFPLLLHTFQTAVALRQTLRGFGSEITYSAAMETIVGNLAIHGTLPAGTGSLVRVAYLNRTQDIPLGVAAATLVSVHWFKLLWLVLIAALGWWLRGATGYWTAAAISLGLLGMVAASLLLPRISRPFAKTQRDGRLATLLRTFAEIANRIRPRELAKGALHTLPIILGQLTTFAILLVALDVAIDPYLIAAVLPLCMIGAKLPITFMGIGTREALVVVLMASSASPQVLLTAGLLFSLTDHVIPALVGTLFTRRFLAHLIRGNPPPGDANKRPHR